MPKASRPHFDDYKRLEAVLSPVALFASKYQSLTIPEYNYHSVHDLALFSIQPDLDFPALQETCERIEKALPALKRIFAKPIINLTDSDDVLPVETVRIINQATMLHLASHTENVADLTKKGLKPQKLLTRIYLDNYGIYENLIFCNLIDEILRFSHRTIASIRDLVYANETIEFNLLERVNHLNYFLSIGKLHMGYIRDFDKYYVLAKDLYAELQSIIGVITPRLHKAVYSDNKIRNKNLPLKKTNIFLMQKDYHQVYLLQKWLLGKNTAVNNQNEPIDLPALNRNYFYYVENLLVFALESFNFVPAASSEVNLEHLSMSFAYKGWTCELFGLKGQGLLIKIKKDKERTILLAPEAEYDLYNPLTKFGTEYGADEALACTPHEKEIANPEAVFLSPENLESFRRLQQIILRGMVYADTMRDECPFCEGQLSPFPKNKGYECPTCHMVLREASCPTTGDPYFYTQISGKRTDQVHAADYKKEDQWLYQRKAEAVMHFRNITRVTDKGDIICPSCGSVHKHKD